MTTSQKEVHKIIRRVFRLRNKALFQVPHCASFRYPRHYLAEVFEQAGFNVGAEIGVRRGNFSKILCRANPKLKLHLVDSWEPIGGRYTIEKQERYLGVTKKRMAPHDVEIIRKRSLDAVKGFFDNSLDFVYIDADHSFEAAMLDIIYWSYKVRKNGIVCVHDYYWGESGVFNAVNAYVNSNRHIRPSWYVTKENSPTAFWVKP